MGGAGLEGKSDVNALEARPSSSSKTIRKCFAAVRDSRYLADALQYRNGQLEVTNMECRQSKLDVTKVSIAVLQGFATGLTGAIFTRYAHTGIQGAMTLYGAIPGQIEEVQVAYFKDGLIDDVLAGT